MAMRIQFQSQSTDPDLNRSRVLARSGVRLLLAPAVLQVDADGSVRGIPTIEFPHFRYLNIRATVPTIGNFVVSIA